MSTVTPLPYRLYLSARYEWWATARLGWVNLLGYKPIRLVSMSYEDYWQQDASAYTADLRADAFESIVEPGSSVADIGCGNGLLLARLRDNRGACVHGFDVSALAVAKANARGISADVWNASSNEFPGVFDYVIIADCMEHIAEPEALVARLRGRFRKALLISIPNSCYWRYRFRVLFGRFMVQWVLHPGEHLRYWSIPDMHWWLGQLGFKAIRTHPTWGIPVLKHLWPTMFAQNVLYVIEDATTHPAGD